MAISTNSIIHYTQSLRSLKAILREGFRLKYCVESLRLDKMGSHAAHPMVSFCDIPLSDSTQHFAAYGRYGIGLTKLWAVQNGINPVIYIDNKSLFAACVARLLLERRNATSNLTSEQKDDILRIKCYAKNYTGPLKRASINRADYRFYDEREWRLVPDDAMLQGMPFSINGSSYLARKDEYNAKLNAIRVSFAQDDISYIIVKTTAEIPAMTAFLRRTYSSRATADQLDILLSKVCSTEQIVADY